MVKHEDDESGNEVVARLMKEVQFLRKVVANTDEKQLSKALQEASSRKSAPLIMDPDRDYEVEVRDAIMNKFKGSKDPEFLLINGDIIISFPDYGPKYKLMLKGPMVRLRASEKKIITPRVFKAPKGTSKGSKNGHASK